jgi:hypothetical protein
MSSRAKRQRVVDDPSDEKMHSFPTALLVVPDHASTSPTKAAKKVTVARERNPRSKEQASRPKSKADQKVFVDDGYEQHLDLVFPTDADRETALSSRSTITDEDIAAFTDAVNAYTTGFYHLEQNLFVVQGYNTEKRLSLVSFMNILLSSLLMIFQESWYHLQYIQINGSLETACTCPAAVDDLCIHRHFFLRYEIRELLDEGKGHSLTGTIH